MERLARRLVLIGGVGLAFGAAFANAGVLLRTGISVSHLTGDIARLSLDLVLNSPEIAGELVGVTMAGVGFFCGALLAGLWIHHPTIDLARPYGRSITLIGVIFLAAHFLLYVQPWMGITAAAFGCGLQNSLATRYRGIVLRTTHLTGLITDLGLTLGMKLRGFEIPRWKIVVPGALTVAFLLGGVCSGWVFLALGLDPVLLAGIGYMLAGGLWTFFKHMVRPGFLEDGDLGPGK